MSCVKNCDFCTAGNRGDSWNTFYFLIFYILCVLAKLNIRAQLGSNIFGLQSELNNFHAIYAK